MPFAAKSIRTRHADIHLWDTGGEGLPLLLIHGSGSSKEVFVRQFGSPLATRHRLLALDLPGHGQSSNAHDPTVGYTIHGFAQAIDEVLNELGVGRIAVFGWSLGGHIAIELTSFSPVVAGLMLTGTPPFARGPLGMLRGFQTNWDLLLASKEHFGARDAERFERLCFDGKGDPAFLEAIKRADGRARAVVFRSMMRGDGADQKQTVERAIVPVAIVNGAQEPFARLSYLAALSFPSLWRDQCLVLDGTGHAPFWDLPDVFNPLLEQFVADVAAQPLQATKQRRRLA